MDEREWLASVDPLAMLSFLGEGPTRDACSTPAALASSYPPPERLMRPSNSANTASTSSKLRGSERYMSRMAS